MGAPLFVAQLGLDVVQRALSKGDPHELERVTLSDVGSMDELLQTLARAPPYMVLQLLNKEKGNVIGEGLQRVAEDLDFTQAVASMTGRCGRVNAVTKAVISAFERRNTNGHFQEGQSLHVDVMMHGNEDGEVDDDDHRSKTRSKSKRGQNKRPSYAEKRKRYYCFDFQKGTCDRAVCRFPHTCEICGQHNHGAVGCPSKPGRSTASRGTERRRTTDADDNAQSRSEVPPHPRFRRD